MKFSFVVLGVILYVVVTSVPVKAAKQKWISICPDKDIIYCSHVGKTAHNSRGNKFIRNIKLGKIKGVSWRPKGSVIGFSEAIPSAGIPARVRKSPRNSHYYIIDDGSENPFLRQCREIDTR